MSFIETIFFELDFLKIPYFLLINRKKKISTIFGSIYSLFIVAITFYLMITSALQKSNPIILDQETKLMAAPQINMSDNNFRIFIALTDPFSKPIKIDPSYLKLNVVLFNITSSKTIFGWDEQKLRSCSNNDLSNLTHLNEIENHYCLDNNNIVLQGDLSSKFVSGLSVSKHICNNLTDNVTCKST